MPAPIVIEVSLPSPPEAGLAVLTSACTRAALGARCVLAKDAHEEVPAAVAIVTFQTADNVRVEVGVRRGEHDVWRTSEFAFLASDDTSERWRTIGFAIGTLAESEQDLHAASPSAATSAPGADATVSSPPAASASPAREPPPAPKPVAPAEDDEAKLAGKSSRAVYLDAAALLGRGLSPSPPRAGGALALALPLPRTSLYFSGGGSLTVLTAERAELSSARWVDVSLGAGASLLGEPELSGLELQGQGLVERFDVSARSQAGRSDGQGRWLFGVEGALRGRLGLSQNLCLTADLRLAALSGATTLRIAELPLGEAPAMRYTGGLGLRVRLR